MKLLKAVAGAIFVLGLSVISVRQVAPALAEQMTPNTIDGCVFLDGNLDGVKDEGEPCTPEVALALYRDANANGLIDKQDERLAQTATGEDGRYIFSIAEAGAFLVKVETKSLPKGAALTTLNRQGAVFAGAGESDSGNDFGYTEAVYVDDEVLVKFREGASPDRVKEILDGYGLKIKYHQEGVDFYLLTTPPGEAAAVIAYLQSYPDDVVYAERNGIVSGEWAPTDPDYADPALSYGLRLIQAEAAWDVTKGMAATIVAVVDTGLSLAHPEFAGRVMPGWDFVNSDADPSDDNGHGTHVAGILAAAMDNGQGSTGVASGVTLLPVKVLGAANSGTWANVASGIVYAVDQGAGVINVSLGGHVPSSTFHDAVAYAAAHDAVVVAGSGNLPDGEPFYPAAYPEVLAVSATDATDAWWTSSGYGEWVDVAAPGDAIWSTLWTSANPVGYGKKDGTSMATGFVSGLAALVRTARPELSALDVRELIQQSSDDKGEPGLDDFYGWGRINAGAALGITGAWATVTPTPTATPTATMTPTNTPTPTPIPYVQRVNAGNTSTTLFVEGQGYTWAADRAYVAGSWGYVSGSAKSYTTAVAGTTDDALYQKLREGMTSYKFTVAPGAYNVTLRFAEFAASATSVRNMQITVNGTVVETGLNVFVVAGGKAIALDRTYTTTAGADGLITIGFTQVGGRYKPMVSAIQVESAGPPPTTSAPTATATVCVTCPTNTPTPTATSTRTATPTVTPTPYAQRVNSGSTAYTDTSGLAWAADKAFATGSWGYVGGSTAKSTKAVAGTADDTLYQKYRTKMTAYKYTVANGAYQVKLKFAEFSTTTVGARAMKITLQGVTVEGALDIYATAGSYTALDRSYTANVTNGLLEVGFAKATGATLDPVISAIEIRQ